MHRNLAFDDNRGMGEGNNDNQPVDLQSWLVVDSYVSRLYIYSKNVSVSMSDLQLKQLSFIITNPPL